MRSWIVVAALGTSCAVTPAAQAVQGPRLAGGNYAALAQEALTTLEQSYYNGAGEWHLCLPSSCATINRDWGSDSLTYALYLHWQTTGDPRIAQIMQALTGTTSTGPFNWSDVPMWDSVAAAREYQITGNPVALTKSEAAFNYVAKDHLQQFALGACPSIYYQHPDGGTNKLKTLETGSNYIKAALLLYQSTHQAGYLQQAEAQYAADRRYFLSPTVPLYTVYVFDDGKSCQQLPARYFGSVNGNMIWAGYYLAQDTGDGTYLSQALATAKAVQQHLGDATGVYADLQAENDVTEPLVEAMFLLATSGHQSFARQWLLTSASASAAALAHDGAYGRFFDGPAPVATATAWQVNGGLALAFAAAALDGAGSPADPGFWAKPTFVPDDLRLGTTPVSFAFTGRAVAIIGTIGEICCESGHAQVLIDGVPTFDRTGIWQNKSSSRLSLPDSVLFAWRWPVTGTHTIEVLPGIPNPKEGTSFFHMIGYDLIG